MLQLCQMALAVPFFADRGHCSTCCSSLNVIIINLFHPSLIIDPCTWLGVTLVFSTFAEINFYSPYKIWYILYVVVLPLGRFARSFVLYWFASQKTDVLLSLATVNPHSVWIQAESRQTLRVMDTGRSIIISSSSRYWSNEDWCCSRFEHEHLYEWCWKLSMSIAVHFETLVERWRTFN